MVASPTTLCNTERAQRESRARGRPIKRGQGQYKGRSPEEPRPAYLLLLPAFARALAVPGV